MIPVFVLWIASGVNPDASLDSSRVCPDSGGLAWSDANRDGSVVIHPILGIEGRRVQGSSVLAGDGGLILSGGLGPLSFALDARIFSETQSGKTGSFDGDFVETQVDGQASDFNYTS